MQGKEERFIGACVSAPPAAGHLQLTALAATLCRGNAGQMGLDPRHSPGCNGGAHRAGAGPRLRIWREKVSALGGLAA